MLTRICDQIDSFLSFFQDSSNGTASTCDRKINVRGRNDIKQIVVCRSQAALSAVAHEFEESATCVCIATEDASVKQAADKAEWVDETTYIDQMESYLAVIDDVSRIVKQVNSSLETVEDRIEGVPEDTLFWREEPVEGRFSGAILEVILLIRSYRQLLQDDIGSLILVRERGYAWEDDILVAVADSLGIPVTERTSLRYRLSRRLDLDTFSGYSIELPVPDVASTFVRYLYQFSRLFRPAMILRKERPEGSEPIAFELGSSSKKHIENLNPPLQDLSDREKYDGYALCWNATDGAETLRDDGIEAIELESWFPHSELPEIIATSYRVIRLGRDSLVAGEDRPTIQYEGIDIWPFLVPYLIRFFRFRTFERLALSKSLEQFFDECTPPAIKLWGAGINDFGRITKRVVENRYDPILFHYNMGEWGVLSFFVDRVDLYMVSGERDKERLEEYGIEADRIAVTGASRYEDIGTFKHRYSVEESTRELGLQDDLTFRIFYAPQCTTRGSLSKQEKEQVTQALVEFAASHPNVGLIIKPHPSDDSGLVENLAAGRTGDDVVVVNRHELPYHCINAADVVITKYSTVGIEAMLFETLVVSVALDDATELQDIYYGDVAEQVQDVRVLQETLNQLRTDYERYATAQGNRREQFLRQKFTQSNNSDATVAVDTILDALAETERDEISTSF